MYKLKKFIFKKYKLIKSLSEEYDKYQSIEVHPQTGELYFRPSWFKPLVIIMYFINHLCFPLMVKILDYLRYCCPLTENINSLHCRSYLLFEYYKWRFKKGWRLLSDYHD